jgi:hypothetical protein
MQSFCAKKMHQWWYNFRFRKAPAARMTRSTGRHLKSLCMQTVQRQMSSAAAEEANQLERHLVVAANGWRGCSLLPRREDSGQGSLALAVWNCHEAYTRNQHGEHAGRSI